MGHITYALADHRQDIRAQVTDVKTQFDNEAWGPAGAAFAELLELCIGPIEPVTPWTTDLAYEIL